MQEQASPVINYVVVSPYSGKYRCGIVAYAENLVSELSKIPNINPFVISNNKNLPPRVFAKFVVKYIRENFNPKNTIIECPEVHGICKDLSPEYFLHVRLHCSVVITASLNGQRIDQEQALQEVEVIKRANVVSLPSKYLLTEMQKHFDIPQDVLKNILIYPNPLNLEIQAKENSIWKKLIKNKETCLTSPKKYDLCFIANFSVAKGIENLNAVLENLPQNYKVCVVGSGARFFKFSKKIKCKLKVFSHIAKKQEVYNIIASSKAFLNLSKFESFGIGMFEALTLKTPVVGIVAPAVLEYSPVGTFSQKVEEIPKAIECIIQDGEVPSLQPVRKQFVDGITNLLQNGNTYGIMNFNISLKNASIQNEEMPKKLFKLGYMQIRKMKKLLRDPALFFTDMYKNIKGKKPAKNVVLKVENTQNVKKVEEPVVNKIKNERKLEPREFAKIFYKNGQVDAEIPGRAVNNERYSSILFLEEDGRSLVHNENILALLAHKEQMSLKEKTLFFIRYAQELERYNFFENYHNILDFRNQLLKSNFKQVKTFYFINPHGSVPFFFRSLFVNARLVLFVNDEESLKYVLQFKNQIDVLVVEKSLLIDVDVSSIRRVIPFEGNLTEQIAFLMQKISIENARREVEIMLPVLGEFHYTSKMQEYNKLLDSNLLDGVVIVKNNNDYQTVEGNYNSHKKDKQKYHQKVEVIAQNSTMQTFGGVAQNIVPNIKGVLLSENAMFRYRTLIARGNVQALFQFALEDNLRIKIVNENEL